MTRQFLILIAISTLLFGRVAHADNAGRGLPVIGGYTLDGRSIALPADLDQAATLLVLVEEDPFSAEFESWRVLASELEGEIPVLVLVTMGDKTGLSRSVSAGRLRRDVGDPDLRARLVPVFQDGSALRKSLDVASTSRVSAVLVNQSGDILWRARGPAGDAASAEIRARAGGVPQTVPGELEPSAMPAPVASIPTSDPAVPPAALPATLPHLATEHGSAPVPMPVIAEIRSAAPEQAAPQFPEIKGVTLAGRRMSLPADLSEDGTLLILLPEYAGDGDVEAALANTPSSEFATPEEAIVLLFVGDAPGFGKAFAAGQLRARFQSDVLRARILPVYMDLPEFEERASLEPAEENKRTILVHRTGAISIAKRRP